jgi:hypothetical protein
MATNYRASLKTTRMQAVRDDIDSGAGAATLEIATAAFASVLIIFTLSDPASVVAGSVLALSDMPKVANAIASGNAAVARIKESGGAVVVDNLTVGTSGTDIIISAVAVVSGNPYNLNSGTITHAA